MVIRFYNHSFLSATFSSANNIGVEPPEILSLHDYNNFHTNFKISTNSETITLSNNSGTIIDQLVVEGLAPDVSIGVSTSTGNIVNYMETTPGQENYSEEFLGSIQNEIIFSENGGLKDSPFYLSLSGNDPSQVIRFTIDGSSPDSLSQIYIYPFEISNNISVRAQIFSDNYLPSPISSESYIFNSNHDIDVLFKCRSNDFDDNSGIYVFGPEGTYDTSIPYFGANFWEDWEHPILFNL